MRSSIKINDYDQFKCTADECPLSCCQEWRIAVDEETLKKWKGQKIQAIHNDEEEQPALNLCECVEQEEDGAVVTLKKDKKCPFLNKKKLCRLVIELGEEYLSETCTTFPRQINEFADRTEYSLAPCCPVVVDLLYENKGLVTFNEQEGKKQSDALLMAVRDMMLKIMGDEAYTLSERMMMIFYSLLDLKMQKELTKEKIIACASSKYLVPIAKAIRKMEFNRVDSFFERNELFLDIVENYRKQKLYVDYLEEISKTAESLEEMYGDDLILEKIEAFETEMVTYQRLLTNYLLADIFGNTLMADMTLEDMIIAFQWITLEYNVIKQGIFLKWLIGGEKTIDYRMIRDYISVISRVTGYDQSDIKEYLENSFENIIWEWGYLALVVGESRI